jgi:stalled ribosome rescue protein Dom34
MGKYAEYKTKKRVKRQKAAEPFIRNCMRTAKRHIQDKEICVVCGDFLKASLTTHHFDKKKNPTDVVTLCGSCHRIFDSSNAGLRELKIRRERYYKYNIERLRQLARV